MQYAEHQQAHLSLVITLFTFNALHYTQQVSTGGPGGAVVQPRGTWVHAPPVVAGN